MFSGHNHSKNAGFECQRLGENDRSFIKPRKLLYLPQLAGLCLTQLPIVLAVKARQTDLFIEEE